MVGWVECGFVIVMGVCGGSWKWLENWWLLFLRFEIWLGWGRGGNDWDIVLLVLLLGIGVEYG